jgi:hypothetical protein
MNETDHTEDIRLIKAAARGDAASVAHIVKFHAPAVLSALPAENAQAAAR